MSKTPDPEIVFAQAVRFHSAGVALRLTSEGKAMVQNHMYPSMHLSFVATELYLKCLLLLRTGEIRIGHDLSNLFKRLPLKDRNTLEASWKADWEAKHYDRLPKEARDMLPDPLTLKGVLRKAEKSYFLSRYTWEDRKDVVFVILDFPDALRDHILTVRPDWNR